MPDHAQLPLQAQASHLQHLQFRLLDQRARQHRPARADAHQHADGVQRVGVHVGMRVQARFGKGLQGQLTGVGVGIRQQGRVSQQVRQLQRPALRQRVKRRTHRVQRIVPQRLIAQPGVTLQRQGQKRQLQPPGPHRLMRRL